MPVKLTLTVPDDLMDWLRTAADEQFRTPESQLLWLLQHARSGSRRHPDNDKNKQALSLKLRELHATAGYPSARVIAQRVKDSGGQASHTTVWGVLNGNRLPSWRILEGIVTALDGDIADFRATYRR